MCIPVLCIYKEMHNSVHKQQAVFVIICNPVVLDNYNFLHPENPYFAQTDKYWYGYMYTLNTWVRSLPRIPKIREYNTIIYWRRALPSVSQTSWFGGNDILMFYEMQIVFTAFVSKLEFLLSFASFFSFFSNNLLSRFKILLLNFCNFASFCVD